MDFGTTLWAKIGISLRNLRIIEGFGNCIQILVKDISGKLE
jgi:hypothetical protein